MSLALLASSEDSQVLPMLKEIKEEALKHIA